jgi:hypothetical protein
MSDESDEVLSWDQLGITKPKEGPLSKRIVREAVRVAIMPHIRAIVEAQVGQACGIKYLVKRDEDGKFSRIGPEGIGDGVGIEVWEKDPSTAAAVNLLHYAIDKPKEQEQEIVVHDGDKIRERLNAWKLAHRGESEDAVKYDS